VPPNCTTDCGQKPVPVTVSVVPPLPALRVAGEMELIAGTGFTIVTDAFAACVGSATLAAVTVTVFGTGSAFGAVYNPVLSITPTAAFPPAVPFTDHETPKPLPLTVAKNLNCALSATCAVCGEMET
jgi:hypothetical protein